MRSKHILIALAGASVVRSVPVVNVESRASESTKNVIIQMFEWTWDSLAAECTNFIGPAGYGYVQSTSQTGLCC